ncbi:MAG: preprotein translocase subunit SecA [Bdellovibrionales bacterium]|nr:preprotein translocase subunit SecA [Bdellovibrionales bacterium]
MLNFLTQVFGTQHEREVKKLLPLVEEINKHEPALKKLSDEELKASTPKFKEQLEKGQSLEELLPSVFAVCREAAWRVLGLRHYDVQLIGGIVLHRGQIAEMKTGEGKTLVATLPVYLNALTGKGVHIVTVNDYLAQRDRDWMGQVYHFLGLTTGTIVHDLSDSERQKAYGADVTYGTNNEFGFDYLRDNMKYSLSSCVQKELNYAIVDECDSILIDEARTPLIISGPQERSTDKYHAVKKLIPHLKQEVHFTIEEKSRTASITEEGNSKIEELLGIENLYDIKHIEQLHHIYQSLKAHYLYKKDVDYMVKDDEVIIVDEFTGRLMPGRRWSEGLHQAVEAKEGVKVKTENQTLSSITFQNYFRMYNKLAGMTGTAETEAVEFNKIYSLDVKVIPTHEPIRRKDHNDVVYKTEQIKYKKIAELIKECHEHHQPVLVGTVNIEKSERLSHLLHKERIPHKVLNAKHHEQEAEIVAQAGRKGAITIATNMAGRGTDIILGGNPEFLAGYKKNSEKETEKDTERLKKFQDLCGKEREEVVKAGGLCIIGTERHESRRIDNQLRGRSGRQGDPGASCFYLSMEDDLMRVFGGERMKNIMSTLRMDEEEPITDRLLTRAIANAQKKVEAHNFEIRKQVLEYDDVMNQQRKAIYELRRQVMKGKNLEEVFRDKLSDVISDILDQFAGENQRREEWNLPALSSSLKQLFNLEITFPSVETLTADTVTEQVQEVIGKQFEVKKQELGEHFEPLIQYVLLQTIDARWMEHLSNIDHLREGINLRAYAQKDPLVEYKKESFNMFEKVNLSVAGETVEKIFKVRLNVEPELEMPKDQSRELIYNEDSQISGFAMAPPSANPSQSESGNQQLNREQRRRQNKQKKHRIKI